MFLPGESLGQRSGGLQPMSHRESDTTRQLKLLPASTLFYPYFHRPCDGSYLGDLRVYLEQRRHCWIQHLRVTLVCGLATRPESQSLPYKPFYSSPAISHAHHLICSLATPSSWHLTCKTPSIQSHCFLGSSPLSLPTQLLQFLISLSATSLAA